MDTYFIFHCLNTHIQGLHINHFKYLLHSYPILVSNDASQTYIKFRVATGLGNGS